MRQRMHPKLMRVRNGRGRTYHLIDAVLWPVLKAFNCPTCKLRLMKGDHGLRGSYLTPTDQFHIRHKMFCSEDCVASELKSK